MGKNLKVYSASAGSGKTYTLTKEYMDVISGKGGECNNSFRNVLAVTFTNKAAAEMKERIVSSLSKAGKKELLEDVLHDYSDFNVGTIDSFFQKVIRSFVHELGLNASYGINLDTDLMLADAVEEIMRSLDEYPDVLSYMIDIARSNVDAFEKWNKFNDALLELGNQLFSEKYREHRCKDGVTIDKVVEFERGLREKSLEAYDCLFASAKPLSNQLIDIDTKELHGGSRCKALNLREEKWNRDNLTVPDIMNIPSDIDKVFKKPGKSEYVIFMDGLAHLQELAVSRIPFIKSAALIINGKYLWALPILSVIEDVIQRQQREQNQVSLSHTSELLHRLIGASDTPFVYEKFGTRINSYFLDEFQDTSQLQYDCFKPLIDDSLAEGHYNLIVGDVKQSIYRFRNSDWTILGKSVPTDFRSYLDAQTLADNWRSDSAIIRFNNHLFQHTEFQEEYKDVVQNEPSRKKMKPGYVEVRKIISSKNEKGKPAENFKDLSMAFILQDITRFHDMGYDYGRITVLTRMGDDAKAVASYLLENGIDVESADSLLISSSDKVKLLVNMIRYAVDPTNQVTREFLSGYLTDELRDEIYSYPLYELSEHLIKHLEIERDRYVVAFQDLILSYSSQRSTNISSFLEYWDEKGYKKSLDSGGSDDAVKVMTIHKSKGLAFDIVLVPFCTWKTEGTSSLMWVENRFEDSIDIGALPIRPSSDKIKNTFWSKEYDEEKRLNRFDSMNMLYVAFTRPVHMLVVTLPEKCELNTIGKFVETNLGYSEDEESMKEPGEYTLYQDGESVFYPVEDDDDDSSERIVACEIDDNQIETDFSRFKFNTDPSEEAALGTKYHKILARVRRVDDLPRLVEEYRNSGKFADDEAERAFELLNAYITNPAASAWFDGTYEVETERSIISADIKRPDRMVRISDRKFVVVDYKFGARNDKRYNSQVSEYMGLLRQMGYEVEGYLYYSNGLEIVRVGQ